DHDELIAHLGTIARSGTAAFGAALADAKPEDRPNLIGQFGVGFYSAFMVADRVEVTSRKAGTDHAFLWSCDIGSPGAADHGRFTVTPAERAAAGTSIVLHLKPDAEEYLDPMRLETIVRKWADHITLPITIAQDGKELAANEGTALWRKPRAEITEASYHEFYRHLGHMFDTPWAILHWRAEGLTEFTALLFIPGSRPFRVLDEERQSQIRLHVRRMFITDKAELLPSWLRFVQGVVDTEDLPLNVSREMLQATPVLGRIRKALVGRVLGELKTRAKDDAEYAGFWENFGTVLKEGVWEDSEHRAELAALLRFRSAATEGWTSLAEYVNRMPPGQDEILYLAGDRIETLRHSPQLEGARARGRDVLLLADPIDSFWPERLASFEGKRLVNVAQAEAPADAELPDISVLTAAMKAALGEAVSDVRATGRLTDSAVVLAAGGHGPDLQMQRMLRRAGRGGPMAPPVLEVNPRHPAIAALAAKATDAEAVKRAAETLLDLARIAEGEAPRDPAGFARTATALLAGSLAL
ncbi:MAG: molecular chaperone HtpG, partial [Rhodospirillales bacterium]|nr:molecular chaperone HtpG [Rhodospirillales bacterium]